MNALLQYADRAGEDEDAASAACMALARQLAALHSVAPCEGLPTDEHVVAMSERFATVEGARKFHWLSVCEHLWGAWRAPVPPPSVRSQAGRSLAAMRVGLTAVLSSRLGSEHRALALRVGSLLLQLPIGAAWAAGEYDAQASSALAPALDGAKFTQLMVKLAGVEAMVLCEQLALRADRSAAAELQRLKREAAAEAQRAREERQRQGQAREAEADEEVEEVAAAMRSTAVSEAPAGDTAAAATAGAGTAPEFDPWAAANSVISCFRCASAAAFALAASAGDDGAVAEESSAEAWAGFPAEVRQRCATRSLCSKHSLRHPAPQAIVSLLSTLLEVAKLGLHLIVTAHRVGAVVLARPQRSGGVEAAAADGCVGGEGGVEHGADLAQAALRAVLPAALEAVFAFVSEEATRLRDDLAQALPVLLRAQPWTVAVPGRTPYAFACCEALLPLWAELSDELLPLFVAAGGAEAMWSVLRRCTRGDAVTSDALPPPDVQCLLAARALTDASRSPASATAVLRAGGAGVTHGWDALADLISAPSAGRDAPEALRVGVCVPLASAASAPLCAHTPAPQRACSCTVWPPRTWQSTRAKRRWSTWERARRLRAFPAWRSCCATWGRRRRQIGRTGPSQPQVRSRRAAPPAATHPAPGATAASKAVRRHAELASALAERRGALQSAAQCGATPDARQAAASLLAALDALAAR